MITSSSDFRRAVIEYEADLVARTRAPLHQPFVEQRRALVRAVDGLDLTPREWDTLRWFLDWDNVDALASIITQARELGATLGAGTEASV